MDDAIGQEDWMEVEQLMGQSQCSEAQRRRVVEEASQHAGEQDLMTFILPVLTEGELHHVLKVLFTRRLWPAVGNVLNMNVSDALNAQIFTEAMDTEDDTLFSKHILPNCNGGQLDSFMMQMITSGQNSSVRKLLQAVGDEKPLWSIGKEHMDRKLLQRVAEEQWWDVGEYLPGLNDLQCRWVIEITCERASDRDISSCILPQCADEQLDIMLTTLVTRGFLQSVDTVLKRGVSPARHVWAIRETCRWADEENVEWYMQTHCSDRQLEEGQTRLVTRGLWETVDIMLNHGVNPGRHVQAIHEACQRADEEDFESYILPHCGEDQLDDVLRTLVTRGLWRSVGKVLSRSVNPARHSWVIHEACGRAEDEDIEQWILPHCNDEQLDGVLATLVTRGLSESLDTVLNRDVSPAPHNWSGSEDSPQAGEEQAQRKILPRSAVEEHDDELTTLVTQGLWQSVDTVLRRGVSPARHAWAIQEACREAHEKDLQCFILPHCNDEQLDDVLTTVLTRGLWETVDIMLNHCVSPTRHVQAIQEACQWADEEDFKSYILPHCSEEQLDDVLRTLLTRGLWRSEGKVRSRSVNPTRHSGVIHEACGRAEDEDTEQWIPPRCTYEQFIEVLATRVARGLWGSADTVRHTGVSPAPHDRSASEDSLQVGEEQAQRKMLPRSAVEEHDDELTTLVTQGLWQSVDTVLRRGVSPARHAWAIQEACREADEEDLQCFILPHCNDEQLDDVLTTVLTRGLWETVDIMLNHCVSPARHVQAIQEACQWADEEDFESYILPHCSEEQLDDVLRTLVTRSLWKSVGKVLSRAVNPARHSWVIHEACGRAEDEDIQQWILPHCTDEQLIEVLVTRVARSLWGSADTVLNRDVSPAPHDRSASEDSLQVGEEEAQREMLPRSAVEEHDNELTTLVTQGLWQSVDTVLHSGVSRARCMWTIYEACRQADEKDLQCYILPHCDDEQLDEVLITLVSRGLWETVDTVLRRGVSPTRHSQAINEACQWADDESFELYILPHCDEGQLDYVLRTLVMRGLWMSAVTALTFTDNPASHTWVILKACQQADDEDIRQWILPNCTDKQLDNVWTTLVARGLWESVDTVWHTGVSPAPHSGLVSEEHDNELTTLVTQGLWQSVDTVLCRGVSPARHAWAIQEACREADEKDLQCFILPHCNYEQLNKVLTKLVTRGMWQSVDTVLCRGVSSARHAWAIHEACREADEEELQCFILPHCNDEQLNEVLTTVVTRGLWKTVDIILNHGVSPPHHVQAIQKACQCADKENFESYILPHCDKEQLDDVLRTFVTRGMWKSAVTAMNYVVNRARHIWVIHEACLRAEDEDMKQWILPNFADEQLDDALTILVVRGLWKSVGSMLHRGVSAAHHAKAISEACQRANEENIQRYILPNCSDEQLDDVLATLVARGLWWSVDTVLYRGVSPTHHTWAIHQACQQAGDEDLEHYILAHCDDQLRDDVLTTLVTRGLWKSVSYVLQKGVIQDKHRWAIRKVLETENSSFIALCMLPPRDYTEELDNETLKFFELLRAEDIARLGVDYRNVWGRLAISVIVFVMLAFDSWHDDTEDEQCIESAFWNYVTNPHYKHSDLCQLLMQLRRFKTVFWRRMTKSVYGKTGRNSGKKMSKHLLKTVFFSVVLKAVIHFMTETWVSEQNPDTQCSTEGIKEQAMQMSIQIQEQIVKRKSFPELFGAIRELCSQGTGNKNRQNPLFALHFVTNLVQLFWGREVMPTTLEVLTCVPVIPGLQSVALTEMQELNKWDVIRRADLSAVWEQVRRRLLTAAMKQGQWDVVAQWANYTLYDDQCLEALEEAYTHKQWRTYLLLADHGPMEVELMRVHYRLTRYAPWDVVLEMFERGADLIECQEGVRPGKKLRILNRKKDDNERRPRYVKLLLLQKKWEARMAELKSLKSALEKEEWSVALYEINRRHRREEIVLALKAALISRVWHVAIYLIRQGIGARLCDGLFSVMLTHQQWDVCRVLLEEGVDPQLGLDALPQLMEQNQWTLVARLMEYDVGDALRRQVMQQALDRKEGSVVWQCIINMEHDHLTVEERQELFYQAFNRENWQAVKPLVEVEDDTGIQHRDAALLEAIEQHQWDVVDHCQLFRANINMVDEDNHTPMHRMAMRRDWEAVEELIKRGGDPNLLDEDGLSVFHRVVLAGEWKLAKLLIEYHGDIHRRAQKHIERAELRTPLEMLIDARQVEVLQKTLMWCPDQGKGVNDAGETTLHVACLTGSVPMLYDQLARKADPLAVTVRGHSALSYAVMCRDRVQETVAECIRLGFSTHQPHLTDSAMDTDRPSYSDNGSLSDSSSEQGVEFSDSSDSEDISGRNSDDTSDRSISTVSGFSDYEITCDDNSYDSSDNLLSSCMLLAVLRGLPVVTQMLYESGACSYRELFRLHTPLLRLTQLVPWWRWEVKTLFKSLLDKIYKRSDKVPPSRRFMRGFRYKPDRERVQECARYLLEVSTTPRSLKATCRHVISRCLRLHKKRGKDVKQLPLMRSMRRYVMFSDLTHPDCGRYTHRQTLEEFLSLDLETIQSLYLDDDSEREDTSEEEESSSDETHTSEEDIYRDLYPDEEESDDDDDNGVLADEAHNNIDNDNCDDDGVLADEEDINIDSDNYDDNGVLADEEDNNTDSDNCDDSEAETDEENEDETASQ